VKRILITGANSYIGTSVENHIKQWPEKYSIDTIDMIDSSWREVDFSCYDTIFHVAGIAHSDNGKITKEKEKLYYEVNTDLTRETAKKAKAEGVKQFVFMSSVIVYGESAPIGKKKNITKDTPVCPANCYGDSKVQAENGIVPLQDVCFNVVVLRPPMIYGKGSKGNFPMLEKFAGKAPIFPKVKNERSMLYIDNLAEFVRLIIENNEKGVFWPQNSEYSNTTEMVKLIAACKGKRVFTTRLFNPLLKLLSFKMNVINKAFGSLTYDMNISKYHMEYCLYDNVQSIAATEGLADTEHIRRKDFDGKR